MAYSAIAVANAFIEMGLRGEVSQLTPMKLQKLLFYTQSWHLFYNDGQPLFNDDFERWPYGPVIPSIYHELKTYRYKTITNKISRILQTEDGQKIVTPEVNSQDKCTLNLINKIAVMYGKLSGTKLSEMTHVPGSAWTLVEFDGFVIPQGLMKEHIHPS